MEKEKRLFTFGCSYTKYDWPTWVDFISINFDRTYNYGKSGAGNYYIYSKLIEANHNHKFNKDDHILIMFTSVVRHDILCDNGDWILSGNIYNSNFYDKRFIEKYWFPLGGLLNSWLSIKGVLSFLNDIGCNYKIMVAFSTNNLFEFVDVDLKNLEYYQNIVFSLKKTLPKISLRGWTENENYESKRTWYSYNTGPSFWEDTHPTIFNHHGWVKSQLSDYYKPEMHEMMIEWEKMITNDKEKNYKIFKNITKNVEFEIY
jgi:hypothetical protein